MLFVLLALLPLDLAAVGAPPPSLDGLRVEAVLQGRRVAARLHNDGAVAREVLVGYTCSGPVPFLAIVDGATRSFKTGGPPCTVNVPRGERLAPGASTLVASQTLILDGDAHTLVVRYANGVRIGALWRGRIQSPPIAVAAEALDVSMRAKALPGQVAMEVVHSWRGPTAARFFTRWLDAGGTPVDSIVVDGVARDLGEELEVDVPLMGAAVVLHAGESFASRGVIRLPRGRHSIRARYRVTAGDYRTVAGDHGNLGDWTGEVETPELELVVR